MFVWLGDIVYADSNPVGSLTIPATIETLHEAFALQKTLPAYAEFAANIPRIIGLPFHEF